ncbi:hypothetical protein W822_09440 [Advenella kashmirensis W13003]|uniref:DUF2971 domain-containing protein n=1 Tax=Advenella kashmirensis W13003 TaxID=1424334 RepID=V8QU76_9BURK|nr:DUF2971 domain-containing protein [Advenella kashmirensis]ETF03501.1 hypothetical protein W822_09440 [Advenella kashmirensis W13003]
MQSIPPIQAYPNELARETKVGRYMGLAQFLQLIETGTAYFPSVFSLRGAEGNKGDRMEGKLNPNDRWLLDGTAEILDLAMNANWPSVSGETERIKKAVDEVTIKPVNTPFGPVYAADDLDHGQIYDRVNQWIDVWCWHQFDHEHIGMWRQYGQGDGAVCIVTTIDLLQGSLSPTEGIDIKVLPVIYREWLGLPTVSDDPYWIAIQKSRVYRDEREVRVVAIDKNCDPTENRDEMGRLIPLDVKRLCNRVVVHPDSPDWVFDTIDRVTQRYLGRHAARSEIYMERRPL